MRMVSNQTKDRKQFVNKTALLVTEQTGNWKQTHSSIGAGVDSFYEYLLKTYILFGDAKYFSASPFMKSIFQKRFREFCFKFCFNFCDKKIVLLQIHMQESIVSSDFAKLMKTLAASVSLEQIGRVVICISDT